MDPVCIGVSSKTFLRGALLKALCFCAIAVGAVQTQAAGDAADAMIANGDFEGAFQPVVMPDGSKGQVDGEVADGWRDESAWGDISIAYSKDPAGHAGIAQKIEVRSRGKGSAQFVQELPFTAGHIYRVTAWVKAASPGRASLMLRQSGSPYAPYGTTNINLTTDWAQVEVTGKATAGGNGLIMFLPTEAGTYWIDDVTLTDVTNGAGDAGPKTSADGILPVPLINADFEGNFQPYFRSPADKGIVEGDIASGWKDDSAWGDVNVAYGRETALPSSGNAAQRIEVKDITKGAVQLNQPVQFKKGRVYRLTSFLRASINTQLMVQLRMAGAPYTTYGQKKTDVSPEWRKVEVYARMNEDADGIVNFNPSQATTYWIDDVKLEDVTDMVDSDQVSHPGNLLQNGSFEAGISEGWLPRITAFDDNVKAATREHLDPKPTLDNTTAADGKQSLLFTVNSWSGAMLSSRKVPSKFGHAYTASVALKSDQSEEAQISLAGTTAVQSVEIGPDWKRFSVTGSAVLGPDVELRVRYVVKDAAKPAHLWVDAAMIEEGKSASPTYLAAFPTELALTIDRPGSIVFDGDAADVKIAVGGNVPDGSHLKCGVENLAGTITSLPDLPLPADSLTINPDSDAPRGVFKIHAQVIDSEGKPLSGEVQKIFARLPHPRDLTPEQALNSYFGCHVELVPEKIAIALATGNRWVRLHDVSTVTRWPNVEATPGVWAWNDDGITAARKAGLNVLGLLAAAPKRATLNPQAQSGYFAAWNVPDAPGALDAWAEYVKQTVSHYKDDITYWEVWNEPYINGAKEAFFPNGTPEQYGELLKRASPVIRATNPKASIVGVCSPGSDSSWLNRALSVADTSNFDNMSFHGYGGRLQGGAKSQFGAIIDELNAVQARHGTPKPLWNTEGGPSDYVSWYVSKAPAMHLQMAAIVRLDVAQIAAGVAKFFPYTMGDTGDYGAADLAEMEYDRSVKPIVAARAVLASMIDGASYAGRTEPVPGVEAHTFKQSDGTSLQVVWSFDIKTHSIDVPPEMKALDILGNPIQGQKLEVGEEPVYFVRK